MCIRDRKRKQGWEGACMNDDNVIKGGVDQTTLLKDNGFKEGCWKKGLKEAKKEEHDKSMTIPVSYTHLRAHETRRHL
eukprot:560943-Prorocentrum_lima.AAC.1